MRWRLRQEAFQIRKRLRRDPAEQRALSQPHAANSLRIPEAGFCEIPHPEIPLEPGVKDPADAGLG